MTTQHSSLNSSVGILSFAWCTIALLFSLAAQSSDGGNTALILDSPPGDFVGNGESWYYTAPDASFIATRNAHNGVSIEMHMDTECWFLDFAAPFMVPLAIGAYEHASAYPFEGAPSVIPYDAGLDVAGGHSCGGGHACGSLGGSFVVTELVVADNGSVVSFHASFVQSCARLNPALRGEVFFNSSAPLPQAHHIWSPNNAYATEGQQFRCQITTSKPETLYSATGLPGGLTVDPLTGLVSGGPREHGQFDVILAATGQSGTANATLSLLVDPPGRSTGPLTALRVTSEIGDPLLESRDVSGTDEDAILDGFYGRDPGYSCKLTFRPLSLFSPPFDISNQFFLVLDAPTGAPLAPGHYVDTDPEQIGPGPQIYITVGTSAANTATGTFAIKEILADPNSHVEHLHASFVQFSNGSSSALRGWAFYKANNVITSCPFAYGKQGTPFEYQIVANNEPNSYSSGALPPGLSLDPQSGRITGTPSVPGSYPVLVSAIGPAATASEDLWFKINRAQSLANISTRAKVGLGQDFLIGGFIIVGREDKRVIIRAIGPSLSGSGLTGELSDPFLELHDGSGGWMRSNDNWRSNQAEVEATGLAPTDDRESAIVTTLASGNYTAIVTGAGGTTGLGLVEIYDISPARNAHLANVSTRCFIEAGDNVLIGGLIVAFGNAEDQSKILLRGLGPSLSYHDIQNYLRDPILELHDSNGAIIASNDNWRNDQEDEIRATLLAPSEDLESALITTLGPGPYTAIVRGKDNGVGVALVEAYHLDN